MTSKVRKKVHPRYKGIAEWKVKRTAELIKPVEYDDPIQGHVGYSPKVLWLHTPEHPRVLWFAYWISTNNTKGKMKWGQGPPMLEEGTLLELFQDAIGKKMFSKAFLKKLNREISTALKD